MYVYKYIYMYISLGEISPTPRHSVQGVSPKVISCFISTGHFPRKSPIHSGSFAENDVQLQASYASTPPYAPRHSVEAAAVVSTERVNL